MGAPGAVGPRGYQGPPGEPGEEGDRVIFYSCKHKQLKIVGQTAKLFILLFFSRKKSFNFNLDHL